MSDLTPSSTPAELAPAWAALALKSVGWTQVENYPALWTRIGTVNKDGTPAVLGWQAALVASVMPVIVRENPFWRRRSFVVGSVALVGVGGMMKDQIIEVLEAKDAMSLIKGLIALAAGGTTAFFAARSAAEKALDSSEEKKP